MSLSTPDSLDRNSATYDFIPYNAIFTSINMPSSSPNYVFANVQTFSMKSAVRYAFCISHASISRSFNAAIVKDILTDYLDTNDENLIKEGAVVVCPPPTSRDFLLKISPSLISNIIWHLIYWYPGGRSSLLPSYASNAGRTFFISCSMASHHNVSPFSLSISMASLTVCGMRSPYLCVFCQYLLAVLDMILSLLLITFFIHHANAGSSTIWLSTAYSASCTGKGYLTSLTWFQGELPYFHCMETSHPLVVSLLLLFPLEIWITDSPTLICVPSVRKSMMALNN